MNLRLFSATEKTLLLVSSHGACSILVAFIEHGQVGKSGCTLEVVDRVVGENPEEGLEIVEKLVDFVGLFRDRNGNELPRSLSRRGHYKDVTADGSSPLTVRKLATTRAFSTFIAWSQSIRRPFPFLSNIMLLALTSRCSQPHARAFRRPDVDVKYQ